MKKYYLPVIISLVLFLSGCSKSGQLFRWTGQTMGTTYHITIITSKSDGQRSSLQIGVDSVLVTINHQMSTWDPESEISRFNQLAADQDFEISPGFAEVLTVAKKIWHLSNGAFDPTVGPLVNAWGFGYKGSKINDLSQSVLDSIRTFIGFDHIVLHGNTLRKDATRTELDLSAIAKGYGVDKVAEYLAHQGIQNFLVEIGGEIRTQGHKSKNKWVLGIDSPQENLMPGSEIQERIFVENAAIATSGDYRNYYIENGIRRSHTIDPKTEIPITHNLASVTVIAPDCATADALATTVMVLGQDKGLALISTLENCAAYTICRHQDGSFSTSKTTSFNKFTTP